ncbi:hypothetical protein ERX46_15160 [Brumimicrobium glaciale]|uniref:Transposase n=1 Tax=Brumimicrobium glaciale TaxID=200475 RepID=A0A4Q4KIJ1_9FLAO|nr:hypothetical protein [Brumimicrobium glaciale]RYM32600.1 hypothetical protein ERX46_15160 [Brumimicrobium glaciale]
MFYRRYKPESKRDWILENFRSEARKTSRNEDYKFWKVGSHAIELFSEDLVWQKINYIHNNPVEAMLVRNPSDWIHSSASNYRNGEGILKEIHRLVPPLRTVR